MYFGVEHSVLQSYFLLFLYILHNYKIMSKHSYTFHSFLPWRMRAIFSEMFITSYQTTQCHSPDDSNLLCSRKKCFRIFLSKIQYLWSMVLNPALHCVFNEKINIQYMKSPLFYSTVMLLNYDFQVWM
jgi:hypothetical protein